MPLSRRLLALLTLVTSAAGAQGAASDTPLHLAASHFEFAALGDSQPLVKPLRVHNGGTAGFTNVHVTRIAYADSARDAKWLVASPRQTSVAPDELAIVGTLCVNPAGLKAGTYRATATVVAHEVPEPVAFTITLVVSDAAAGKRSTAPHCGTAVKK